MFSSVANLRLTFKRSHNCNVLQEVVEVEWKSKGTPIFKSQQYWGVENILRYLNMGYNHPLEER